MTMTPSRDTVRVERDRPSGLEGPVDRPQRQRQPLDKRAWGKAVMLLNVVLIAGVAIIGLERMQSEETPAASAVEPGPIVASTLPDPNAEPTPAPDTDATAATSSGASSGVSPTTSSAPQTQGALPPPGATPPAVRVTTRVNFAKGDGWPVGAGFRETGRMAWPLGVVDRLMTHGPPQGANAVSWLEKWTKSDVRTIGARVLFAPNHSGAAVLTAWHTSILATSGLQQPRTGMRLVVTPGAWRLVAIDAHGPATLASATYAQSGHAATFSLVRREDTVWVTDPTGTVTPVTDARVATLSGPWASWELRDDKPGKRPAGFQEIWAG